ncbi:MAG: hypothetical protein MRECE_32c001 [Mycoplasmataceae bacterium CE_OT135]|nr:MAG: hypothetical protein MRECE_32c001 [Mycoplasmataceae bacterium CE_OT135]
MVAIFKKKDPLSNWKGCEFEFYLGEFIWDPNKEVHIHVIDEKGSMKIRLNPVERDESQDTDISPTNQRKIIKFVEEHLEYIKKRIREELEKRNIKINQPF